MKGSHHKRSIAAISLATVVLIFGMFAISYAEEEEHRDRDDQKRKEEHQAEDQRNRQQQEHQAEDERNRQQQEHQGEEHLEHHGEEQREHHEHEIDQRAMWHGFRAHNWRSEHRSWRQRGGYGGYRIPRDRFRMHFGKRHSFRISSLGLEIIEGTPRFSYNGYRFSCLDPWPEYWSDNWYENDDVYIDYSGDGYYLFNRRYPHDRIAVSFYLP